MEKGPTFFEETQGAILFLSVLATATPRLLSKVAYGLDGTILPMTDLIANSKQSTAMEVCFTPWITLLWLDECSTLRILQNLVSSFQRQARP